MPATHLIRVDLPAPLSPTSATTSPFRTSKSTSESAWTDPNDFDRPRIWRRGVSFMAVSYHIRGGGTRPGASASFHCRSEEHTSELQSRQYLVCRLLLEKKKKQINNKHKE